MIFEHQVQESVYQDLTQALLRFEITTRPRLTHFLAQCAHESGGGRWLMEFASGDDYEGRSDLGNTQPGDGRKYKGSGLIQITGRGIYQAFSDYIKDSRIMEGCSYVAQNYPAMASGFWWYKNKMNPDCDQGRSCRQISAIVNGRDPANGLQERERYYQKACQII